jgi:hypothetical protein
VSGGDGPPDQRAGRREVVAILWVAAAFIAVAVVGFLVVPAGRVVWAVLLFFGVIAVPQAFLHSRNRPRE